MTENLVAAMPTPSPLPGTITIGICVNSLGGTYQRMVTSGAIEAAKERGVNVVLFLGGDSQGAFGRGHDTTYDLLNHRVVSGAIVLAGTLGLGSTRLRSFCESLQKRVLHLVTVASDVEGIHCVGIDNAAGMREVLDHLAGPPHEYKRLAFIRGPDAALDAMERHEGYREGLRRWDLTYDADLDVPGSFHAPSGQIAMRTLIHRQMLHSTREPLFDAVIAANDEMAIDALEELRRSWELPWKVAVVGFDDTPEARSTLPLLTTVRQPLREQGRRAVEILLRLIDGRTVDRVTRLSDTELRVRHSCGCKHSRLPPTGVSASIVASKPEPLQDCFGEFAELGVPVDIVASMATQIATSRAAGCADCDQPGAVTAFLEAVQSELDKLDVVDDMVESNTSQYHSRAITLWHNTLTALRERWQRSSQNDSELRRILDDAIHEARMLVVEAEERIRLGERTRASYQSQLFGYLSRDLLRVRDMDGLGRTLRTRLPSIGIQLCHVWQLERLGRSEDQYSNSLRFDGPNSVMSGFPRLIAPVPDVQSVSREWYGLVVLPLQIEQLLLGCAVFDLGSIRLRPLYEWICEHISGALNTVVVNRKTARYEDVLFRWPQRNDMRSTFDSMSLWSVLGERAEWAEEVLDAGPVVIYEWDSSLPPPADAPHARGNFAIDSRGPAYTDQIQDPDHMRMAVHPGDVVWMVMERGRTEFYDANRFRGEFLMGWRAAPKGEPPSQRMPFAMRENIRAMAAVVLVAGGEPMGVMFVNYRRPVDLNDEKLQRLHKAVGDFTALTIYHARLQSKTAGDTFAMLDKISAVLDENATSIAAELQERRAAEDALELMRAQSAGLAELAEWLRKSFRSNEPVAVDMSAAAAVVVEDVGRAPETPPVRLISSSGIVNVRAQVEQLSEVLSSLIGNVLDFGSTRVDVLCRAGSDRVAGEVIIEFDAELGSEQVTHIFAIQRSVRMPRPTRGLWYCRLYFNLHGGSLNYQVTNNAHRLIGRLPLASGPLRQCPE